MILAWARYGRIRAPDMAPFAIGRRLRPSKNFPILDMSKRIIGYLALFATLSLSHGTAMAEGIERVAWLDLNKDGTKDVYEDPAQSIDRRIEDLLRRMTPSEKLGQLHQGLVKAKSSADAARDGEVGSFLAYDSPEDFSVAGRRLQHIAMENSRLGIPLIFGFDAIHGCRTIFPIPLAISCSWEPQLLEATNVASGTECQEIGVDWAFSPMVDLARDPRWGRIAEGFGEDPYLGAQFASAAVRGYQGRVGEGRGVVACPKHYVGYGAAEGGRDYDNAEITPFTLWNYYLPAFKSAVDAGALTLMSAYNSNGGMPATGNSYTLREVLRHQWHFDGFVVSDYGSVVGDQGLDKHGLAGDDQTAARMAITAGVDMEMVSSSYWSLREAVTAGKFPQAYIDEAVRRVLRVKFQRGLFDRPPAAPVGVDQLPSHPELISLARDAAVKSCVLLKNANRLLPLPKNIGQLALIGPFIQSKSEPLGTWPGLGSSESVVTLEQGVRRRLAATSTLLVAEGCDLTSSNQDGFGQALELARQADVTILAVGEPANWSGEAKSRSTLGLTGVQEELFEALAALGKPLVVILSNGRPLAIPVVQEKATAVLETWQLGMQSGNAIADVLFGNAAPSGRLTAGFPRSVGQLPIYYNHLPVRVGYVDGPDTPLYPFGFGLSYTTFEYGPVALSATQVGRGQSTTASVVVKNTGERTGEEVVQLYLHAESASAGSRPVKELKGFQKISLEPGETREVSFTVTGNEMGYYDAGGKWLVEAGTFNVWIAPDSASGKSASFVLKY